MRKASWQGASAPHWGAVAFLCLGAGGCLGAVDAAAGPVPDGRRIGAEENRTGLPEPTLFRLSAAQYRASVAAILPAGIALPAVVPDTDPLGGYTSLGAAVASMDPRTVEEYEQAAFALAKEAFADPARTTAWMGCDAAAGGEACVRAWLTAFGRRAFRRPLSAEELDEYAALHGALEAELPDGTTALEFTLAAILQSPHFLYRAELGEADPLDATRLRLTPFELATRLSFMVWGVTPDDALLDAAAAGALDSPEGIVSALARLLEDDRSVAVSDQFFREWTGFEKLATAEKDGAAFPAFNEGLRFSMALEAHLLFRDLAADESADVRSLFSTRATFVNGDLANYYGVALPPGADPAAFTEVEFPADSRRGGLLGRAAVATLFAHRQATSPTHRGKFVRTRVLCAPVAPPPPDANASIPELPEGAPPMTLRQRLEATHLGVETCAGCHALMDPIGFAMEELDAVGQLRTTDNSLPVDASADIDGQAVSGAAELGDVLAADPRVADCIADQFVRYGVGSTYPERGGELLGGLLEDFRAQGGGFRALLRALVTSEAFRYVDNT